MAFPSGCREPPISLTITSNTEPRKACDYSTELLQKHWPKTDNKSCNQAAKHILVCKCLLNPLNPHLQWKYLGTQIADFKGQYRFGLMSAFDLTDQTSLELNHSHRTTGSGYRRPCSYLTNEAVSHWKIPMQSVNWFLCLGRRVIRKKKKETKQSLTININVHPCPAARTYP